MKNTKPIKKAVIYIRVSSKEQEREGYSLEAQKKLLVEYALKHDLRVVKVFSEAETAKMAGRKQFQKMVRFLADNPDCKDILVEKVDRMYRNFHDLVVLDIDKNDLYLHFVKDGKVLSKESKPADRLQHDVQLVLAKNYINNLSEEVKKGMNEKVAQGGWPGEAPIGYVNRLEDHSIQIHPENGPLVVKAFELAATGNYSLNRLKKEMFRRGLLSKRAKREMSKSAMSLLLKNPFYYGHFKWKEQLYKGKHQPLIDKSLFDLVQEKMGLAVKPGESKKTFKYRGLLSCGHCGCTVTAETKTKKSGKSYTYYHCTNGKGHCENVTYLREERIEDKFAEALAKISIPPTVLEWTREALLASADKEQDYRNAQKDSFTNRYNKLDGMIGRAYEDKLEGKIDNDFWEAKTAVWKNEQQDILIRLEALSKANTNFMLEGVKLMELASRASELFPAMSVEEKQETLSLVLSNPRVVNGSVRYDYKKPFDMFVNVTDFE